MSRAAAAIVVAGALWALTQSAKAQEAASPPTDQKTAPAQPRLLDREPTDLLKLRGGKSLVIRPLPQRQLPANPQPGDTLVVELPEAPGESFEVSWRNILEVKLFEQQLLEEARRLTAEGQRDEAYDYFQALRTRYPKLPGLTAAVADFYAAEADTALDDGAADRAWGLLFELRALDANYPGLRDRLGAAVDRLVAQSLEKGDLGAVRGYLDRLAEADAEHPSLARWAEEMAVRSADERRRAAQLRAAGSLAEALLAAQSALRFTPHDAESRALVAELHSAASWVAVAVASPARFADPDSLDDWAARRISRLLAPGLFELADYSNEGGRYTTRFGEAAPNELELQISLALRRDLRPPEGGPALTGGDVALRLLARADPSRPEFNASWANVFRSVAVANVYDLDIRFRSTGLRPQAFLQFPIAAQEGSQASAGLVAAYAADWRVAGQDAERLDLEKHAAAREPGAPRRLTERWLADPVAAEQSLDRGDVAAIDRVAPWRVAALSANARLAVEAYAVPTLCVLAPNGARALASNRTFRRAVQYGIHRQAILEHQLVRGPLPAGTQLVSGPFPAESYATAPNVALREYEPYLAKTLLEVALAQTQASLPPREEGAPIEIVISLPPTDPSRVACQAIERQLERLGLKITLREEESAVAEADRNYDFRYAELFIAEPAVDAFRLFGPGGQVTPSVYLQRAVRQLGEATDWPTARQRLHRIHELVHEELAVIPLWQIREHLARDRRLSGLGERPVGLYAAFDTWRLAPWSPEAAP